MRKGDVVKVTELQKGDSFRFIGCSGIIYRVLSKGAAGIEVMRKTTGRKYLIFYEQKNSESEIDIIKLETDGIIELI